MTDRYRLAWQSARQRATVLSAEVTRRAPLLGEYAAENTKLHRWHDEDRDALTEMRATIERLRKERDAFRIQAENEARTAPPPASSADLRTRFACALSAMTVPFGSQEVPHVPILGAADARWTRIHCWQPLDSVLDKLIAAVAEAAPAEADGRALRDRIAIAIDDVFTRWQTGLGGQRPQDAIRDAVLAVLPAPADRDAEVRAVARVRQMTDAWEQRLPATIQTATVVDAIRHALEAVEPRCMADEAQQARPARPDGVVDDELADAREASRHDVLAALADTLLALLPEHSNRSALLHAAAERVEAERGRRCWEADVLRGLADEAQQAGERP